MSNRRRLLRALGAYAVLAAAAGFRLDGKLRAAVLILLGALALLTWIHARRQPET